MKIIIISPNIDTQMADHVDTLKAVGNVVLVKDKKPFEEITELYEGDEPRVIAVDPDYCEWKLPNDVIDKIPNLKAICLQTTSFSWVDIDHCRQKNIPVVNLRGFSSIAVAEWATMLTLALARRLPLLSKIVGSLITRNIVALSYEVRQRVLLA